MLTKTINIKFRKTNKKFVMVSYFFQICTYGLHHNIQRHFDMSHIEYFHSNNYFTTISFNPTHFP